MYPEAPVTHATFSSPLILVVCEVRIFDFVLCFSSEEQGSNCAGTGADKEWRHGSLKKNSQQEYGGIYIYIYIYFIAYKIFL